MILPFLAGFLSFRKAPATWSLFLLNLFMICFLAIVAPRSQRQLEELARDKTFTQIQGRIFAHFVLNQAGRYPSSYEAMAEQALRHNSVEKIHVLGMLAMRDTYFFHHAKDFDYGVDPVEKRWWIKKAGQFLNTRDSMLSYGLGVTENDYTALTWLTYQFTHSDWGHFLSNMLVFLIFGTALELAIGSLGLLVVSLASGAISALTYLLIDNVTAIPLIGASGAVSGVIALFCMLYWRTGVRHIYFLFIPKRGYLGFVYLPAWIIFILWVISDLAGYVGTPRELGGVAYSAHLGGEFCGVLVGLTYMGIRWWRLRRGEQVAPLPDGGPMTGPILARLP